ncbi:MAG TPA: YitT family protein [Firmicutes bacterium]|nr:YitT family protein [Bacillota bacterium]
MHWRRQAMAYAGVTLGALLVAIGLDWLLVPNKIAAGGVSGLATVLHHLFRWPVGVTMLAINIPLFAAALKVKGLDFGIKSLLGAVLTSIFVDLFAPWAAPVTTDPALASFYGGVIIGVGAGLTIRAGGSTGGTDLAAQLLHRYTNLSVGRALLIVDGVVILCAGLVFHAELALWALIAVFLTTKTLDLVQEGRSVAKMAFIISDHAKEIAAKVLREMDRGVTALQGRGMYSGQDREVLLVIVSGSEIDFLRQVVQICDPRAFVVITDAFDVLGEGFRTHSAR